MSRQSIDYISNGLYKLENAKDAGSAASQARSYVYGLKERGLVEQAEADKLLANVTEVERQIKDKQAAINAFKGFLPWATALGGSAVAGYSLNKLIGGLNAP